MDNSLNETEYTDSYSTGDVHVPKNYRGLVSGVLLAVIFFCGLFSILSIWGFGFTRQLPPEQQTAVRFADEVGFSEPPPVEELAQIDGLGIQGRFLSTFDQRYFQLPPGIYITDPSALVPELQVGDVLMKINGREVTDQVTLDALIDSQTGNGTLSLQIYRNGQYQILSATLYKEN